SALAMLTAGGYALDHGIGVLRDPRITCGGHVMKPGDTCTTIDPDDGTRTKDDYQGMQTDRAVEGYVSTIVGGLLASGALAGLLVLVYLRRRLVAWIEGFLAQTSEVDSD